jgi:hypothetical protein
MTQDSSSTSKPQKLLFRYISVIAAIVTMIGTIHQIMKPEQIRVFSDPKLYEENKLLVTAKNKLELEKQTLEKQIMDLNRKIDMTQSQAVATPALTLETDYWFVTAFKTLVVYVVLTFSAILTILTFLGDLVGLFFGYSFDLTKALWGFSWSKVTINWYWNQARWYGIVAGIAIIGILSSISELTDKYIGAAIGIGKHVVAIVPEDFDPSQLPLPLRARRFLLIKRASGATASELPGTEQGTGSEA